MKMPLAWHKQCLVNATLSAQSMRESLKRQIESCERLEEENRFSAQQIAEAERKGMDGFDPDRFMANRRVKR